MAWTTGAWTRSPYAAGEGTEVPPPPGRVELPPPIPGATRGWIYTPHPVLPWAWRGWGAASLQPAYPGGGVVIAPRPGRGVMRVLAWWPDTPAPLLVRQHPDGSLHPVRGGYPLPVRTGTRHNRCPNPSVEVGLHGYLPGAGNPDFARVEREQGWAWHATAGSAGEVGVVIPVWLPGGQPVTLALDLHVSTRPDAVTLTVGWVDDAGLALPASTAALAPDQVNASIGQYTRHTVHLHPPAGAVTATTLKLTATGLPAEAFVAGDRVVVEQGITTGTYFDGDQLGATWTGTPGLSTSLLAPVAALDDGECPLDQSVQYVIVNGAVTGGQMSSDPATLDSGGRTWLTHPTRASAPVTVDLRETPKREHDLDQGVFWPIGRHHPIVVTGTRRRAATGTVGFNATSRAERDTLLALLDDAAPVLLRTPGHFHFPDSWLALGAVVEDPEDRKAWQDAWLLTADFHTVDPPSLIT